jgi:hypothetical protein
MAKVKNFQEPDDALLRRVFRWRTGGLAAARNLRGRCDLCAERGVAPWQRGQKNVERAP